MREERESEEREREERERERREREIERERERESFWLRTPFRHYSFCETLHLKCLNNLYSDLRELCAASDTFKILAYSALCFFG